MVEISQIDIDLRFKAGATVGTDSQQQPTPAAPAPTYVQPTTTYKTTTSYRGKSPSQAHFTAAFGAVFRKNPRILVINNRSSESKRAVDNELVKMGYDRNAGLTIYESKINQAVSDWFKNNPRDQQIAMLVLMELAGKTDGRIADAIKNPSVEPDCEIAKKETLALIVGLKKVRTLEYKIRKRFLKNPLSIKHRKDLTIALKLLTAGRIRLRKYYQKLKTCNLSSEQLANIRKFSAKVAKTIKNSNEALKKGQNCEAVIASGSRMPKQINDLAFMLTEATIRYKNTKSQAAKQNLTRIIDGSKPVIKSMTTVKNNCVKCGADKLGKQLTNEINNLKKVIGNAEAALAAPMDEKTVLVRTKQTFPSPALTPEEISPFSPYEPEIAPAVPVPYEPEVYEPEQIVLKERKRNVGILVVAAATVPWILTLV